MNANRRAVLGLIAHDWQTQAELTPLGATDQAKRHLAADLRWLVTGGHIEKCSKLLPWRIVSTGRRPDGWTEPRPTVGLSEPRPTNLYRLNPETTP